MPAPVPTGIDGAEVTAAIAAVASAIFALRALQHSKGSTEAAEKSAEAAEKSAAAAERANNLMTRQLALATEEQNRKQQKELLESQPLFNWTGGSYSPAAGIMDREFENLGAMVTDVKIETDSKGILASVAPNVISNNARGKITFTFEKMIGKDLKPPISFTISCVTKLGERWVKTYKYIGTRTFEKIIDA